MFPLNIVIRERGRLNSAIFDFQKHTNLLIVTMSSDIEYSKAVEAPAFNKTINIITGQVKHYAGNKEVLFYVAN